MIDAENPHAVMGALGTSVVDALGRVVSNARADLHRYREVFPEWVAQATARGTKSWIHDRLFDHVQRELGDMDCVTLKVSEPAREFMVDGRFRFRVKAHQPGDLLASYPTAGARQFMRQGSQPAFPELGEIRLVAGYRWDVELMEMAEAVISMRNGNRCIWAVELQAGTAAGKLGQFTPIPIAPAPGIALKIPGLDATSDG